VKYLLVAASVFQLSLAVLFCAMCRILCIKPLAHMIPEVGDLIEHSESLTRFLVGSRYKDGSGAVFLRDHPRGGTGEVFPANGCEPVELADLVDLECFEISVGGKPMRFEVSHHRGKHRFSCGSIHVDIPAEDAIQVAETLAKTFQGEVVTGLTQLDIDSLLGGEGATGAA
jgi:hypothetical protein